MDWEKAKKDEIVCYCKNVTKGEIVRAMYLGAVTLEDIMKATSAGTGGDCARVNPRGRCCHSDIRKILEIYGEAVDQLRQPCCSDSSSSCDCGSC